MSGIDKIIQQIEADTDKVCASVIGDAQAEAEAVIAEAQEKAQAIIDSGKENTAARVTDIKKRGDSAADLEEKRVMLAVKQQIISAMLANGVEAVKSLPDDEYFLLLQKMVEKYSQPQDGVICFGEKDRKRLPDDYITTLNQTAKGKIALADTAAPIEAGFILQYGGIEQNCSFDAIFAGEAENLSDKAGRLLF